MFLQIEWFGAELRDADFGLFAVFSAGFGTLSGLGVQLKAGRLAATDVGCRTWSWQGKQYGSPAPGMIVDAVLRGNYAADAGVTAAPPGEPSGSV